jgi:hypothetical protein
MDRQDYEGADFRMVNLNDLEKYAKEFISGSTSKQPHLSLDSVELLKRSDNKGVVKEIRSIYSLSVFGGRSIVELPIPGSTGNVFQDMGRSPLIIDFDGLLVGPDAMETLKSLKEKFELGKPLALSSNIGVIQEIDMVVIEKFSAHFDGGVNLGARYKIILKEFLSSSKEKSKKEAPSLLDQAVDSVKDMITKVASDKLGVKI